MRQVHYEGITASDQRVKPNKVLTENRPANIPDRKIPAVSDVIGRALDHIGTYSDLDNR